MLTYATPNTTPSFTNVVFHPTAFRPFENRPLKVVQPESPQIVTAPALSEDLLRDLFEDRILAIHVPNYCHSFVAHKLSQWFLEQRDLPAYTHELYKDGVPVQEYFGVYRYGSPYNKTYGKPATSSAHNEYYQAALQSIRNVRQACLPYAAPMDRLRNELDENLPMGAQVANYEGRKMFVGIGRITPAADSHILQVQPHVDCLPQDICQLDGQFAANIYLRMPSRGGAVELWDVPALSPEEIAALPQDHDWRAELPESTLIYPEVGDLLLFNTRKPHAVHGFNQGVRISVQCFMGYRKDSPLSLWC